MKTQILQKSDHGFMIFVVDPYLPSELSDCPKVPAMCLEILKQ
jgi:hypothetical protein